MSDLSDLLSAVQSRAAGYNPAQVLLLTVAVPLLAAGWLAGLLIRGTWVVAAWMWAACVEGYRRGRNGS